MNKTCKKKLYSGKQPFRYSLVNNTVTKNWESFTKHTESNQTTTKSTLVQDFKLNI